MAAYYNEIDPYAAEWLRNLIHAGHIAPGDIDTRSIEDVHPDDLRGYAQCHFFAGIGVWSYALRLAGWPDDRSVWTGSCPCQPFSTAGKGAGFADERHLWPAWHWLIQECRPATVFGEQVASKNADPWLDLVFTDLEALDYACGAVPFPAAGIGAPHIRDRLYWVAHDAGLERWREPERECSAERASGASGVAGGLADLHGDGREPRGEGRAPVGHRTTSEPNRGAVGLADAESERWNGRESSAWAARRDCFEDSGDIGRPRPTNGFWRDADWLFCRDGRWRPVEPGTFPLAHGAPARVGRLRAYGNAINAQQARIFIETCMELMP